MVDRTPPGKLTVRTARLEDAPAIARLFERVYPNEAPYSLGMIQGQIARFSEGQFLAEYNSEIVGYAASFRIDGALALGPHTWMDITGGGYAARHDPGGAWLYGMEVGVDPTHRRLRIGQRIYDARKRLCEDLELRGIVFGGRLPGLARRLKEFGTPEAYLEAVKEKEIKDPVAAFQFRNDFEPIGILHNYLPSDKESLGCAAHMVWRNPYLVESSETDNLRRDPTTVRIATVQLQARAVKDFSAFLETLEYFIDAVSDLKADFVVLPELCTLQVLAGEPKKPTPEQAIESLARHTPVYRQSLRDLALRYNVNIIGGSHFTQHEDGHLENVAFVFLRDGSVHTQAKLHPTPTEAFWWNIKGGHSIRTIPTDCGPIGVMLSYDIQFPELSRRLCDEGARLLFVPFAAETRQDYLRIRYCAQARAIENQVYVALAGNVGNLPNVENMDVQYARSCILTPCDFPFARDGIAEEASENVETVTVADLNLDELTWARAEGTTRNLRDRRFDLYRVVWSDGG